MPEPPATVTVSPVCGDQPMSSVGGTIYLGLDVHKDSVTIAVLPEGAVAPSRVELTVPAAASSRLGHTSGRRSAIRK